MPPPHPPPHHCTCVSFAECLPEQIRRGDEYDAVDELVEFVWFLILTSWNGHAQIPEVEWISVMRELDEILETVELLTDSCRGLRILLIMWP